MHCRKCGNEIGDDTRFCPECGGSIASDSVKKNIKTFEKLKKKPAITISCITIIIVGGGFLLRQNDQVSQKVPADGEYIVSGDCIVFGNYEQDGNLFNGSEPVEWEILVENDDSFLIISRFILACQPYYKESDWDGTWENSSLRNWMNKDFYSSAFSTADQSRILISNISNPDNPYSGIEGGNDTNDKVFCLSVEEISEYYSFESWTDEKNNWGYSSNLVTEVTPYAKKGGVYESGGGTWWLRSPGERWSWCTVGADGKTGWRHFNGDHFGDIGVRPALWIKK